MHNRNRRHRKFRRAAFGEVKRGTARTTGRVIDTCRSAAASVLVSVPPVYIYTKSDGFGSPPRCRRCRVNDDSITRAEPRLYRDNPAEVGGTARSWRPETHVDTSRARATLGRGYARLSLSRPPLFFFFSFFLRAHPPVCPPCIRRRNENGEYTLIVTREQSDKESPTARIVGRRESAECSCHNGRAFTSPMSDDSLVSFKDLPAGWTFRRGDTRTSKLRKRLFFASIRELGTKGKILLEAWRFVLLVILDRCVIGTFQIISVPRLSTRQLIKRKKNNNKNTINLTNCGGQFTSGKANLGFRLLA